MVVGAPRVRLAAATLVVLLARPLAAATVPYLTDEELVARSSRIVHARVLGSRAAVGAAGLIHTSTDLAVVEDFTGIAGERLAVVELGGAVDGQALVVPGAPHLQPGQDVLLCLERTADGRWRTVALSFSAFTIVADRAAGEVRLQRRMTSGLHVVGGPREWPQPPTLQDFRRLVAAVKGTVPWRAPTTVPLGAASVPAQPTIDAEAEDTPVGMAFSLLGGGLRWHEADLGVPVRWFRNPDAPAPVSAGTGDAEMALALSAWSAPASAALQLQHGGLRSAGTAAPFCSAVNAGAGLVTFEDPTNELPSSVLALGGGCIARGNTRVVNGVTFQAFSHAFVVFNRAAEVSAVYRTPTNFARILQHEIGHGIGLGHVDVGAAQASANIMYPACCLAATPVPPALGPDDLAGLGFIYPALSAQSCAFGVTPLEAAFSPAGGSGTVAVTTTSLCEWSSTSPEPWIQVSGASGRAGSGSVSFVVAANAGPVRQAMLKVAGQDVLVSQASLDGDADSLPDQWEEQFGLSPTSAGGADGGEGDPDGDGRSNRQEYEEGTHPRGVHARTFAEGAVTRFFSTRFALFNASTTSAARALIRALPAGGSGASTFVEVPALGRRTVVPADLGLSEAEFATSVESDLPLVVERTMMWDAGRFGAHSETGVPAPAARWYFAEGATHSGFDLFYLIANPGADAVDVRGRFLLPAPDAPIDRVYRVAGGARRTVWVDTEDPALAATDVSAVFTSTGGPIVVERAMYLSRPGAPFLAGHAGAGMVAPGTTWWFAEGATGSFFDSFLLVLNPSPTDATLEIEYLLPHGDPVRTHHRAAAGGRTTIWVDAEDVRTESSALAIRVTSTNAVPIVVERAMWWPGPATRWTEGNVSGGLPATASRWAAADVDVGGNPDASTFILVANTAASPGSVTVTLACEGLPTTSARTLPIAAASRLNIDVGGEFPEARGRPCAVVVERSGGAIDLVVERATYWTTDGGFWTAGASAAASPVP
jgi:hypothetical protein